MSIFGTQETENSYGHCQMEAGSGLNPMERSMTRKTALGQQLSTKGQSLQRGESLSLANSSMDADQAHRSQIGLRNPNKNKESPKRRNPAGD